VGFFLLLQLYSEFQLKSADKR